MTIYDEVRNGLKNYLSQNSTYKPSVKPFASGNDFPYVVFEKINDTERESDSSRNTVISSIEFEINIYAKDMSIQNKMVAGRSIATEIEESIKRYMGDRLGFKRNYDRPTPNIDETVYRITMRYQIKFNERRKYFI